MEGMSKTKTLYKFLRTGLKSNSGDYKWKVGEWYKEEKLDICNSGFHASKTPLQALGYVAGEIVAKVEVKGHSIVQDDKECWSEMRIVKAWNWEKKDSVALSIFSAELCLKNFEKLYPDDKRPREAIEAAKKVLEADTEENRSAAESAAESAESAARSAAESAESAESAAESAARSAESAARSAARSAAWSAESAARSAESAARSAAKKKFIASIDKWFLERIKTLTEIK